MVNSHIAHDCQIGNQVVLANGVLLAGHVTVEDGVFISGHVVVHQFVRIGRLAMIGGLSRVTKDIPPFMLVRGEDTVYTINIIGLRRAGYSEEQRKKIKEVFETLYHSGLNVSQALERLSQQRPSAEVTQILDFIKGSKRGISKGVFIEEELSEDLVVEV